MFNGYVTNRLSEGAGTEYLFSLKWLPLIFLFTWSYFQTKEKKYLCLLAIPTAFLFEGSPNTAFFILIGLAVFAIVYTISTQSKIKYLGWLALSGILAGLIYAVKLLPVVGLMAVNGSSRLTSTVIGSRINHLTLKQFLVYYLPIIPDQRLTGIFTPGLIGFILLLFGLSWLAFKIVKKRPIEPIEKAFLGVLILGIILTVDSPISNLLVTAPIFNRFTVIPSTLALLVIANVFLIVKGAQLILTKKPILTLIPVVAWLIAFFFQENIIGRLIDVNRVINLAFRVIPVIIGIVGFVAVFRTLKRFLNGKLLIYFCALTISLLVFVEILWGPATFGTKSYSFGFLLFNYKQELADFSYLGKIKGLLDQTGGRIYFPHYNRNWIAVAPPYATFLNNTPIFGDDPYYFGASWTTDTQNALDNSLNCNPLLENCLNKFNSEPSWSLIGAPLIAFTNECRDEDNNLCQELAKGNVGNFQTLVENQHRELTVYFNQSNLIPWDHLVKIYKNPKFVSEFAFVPNEEPLTNYQTAQVTKSSPLVTTLKVPTGKGQILISKTYSPYFQATLNNMPIKIAQNGAFMSVTINQPGTLVIRYWNPFIYDGLVISFLALLFTTVTLMIKSGHVPRP